MDNAIYLSPMRKRLIRSVEQGGKEGGKKKEKGKERSFTFRQKKSCRDWQLWKRRGEVGKKKGRGSSLSSMLLFLSAEAKKKERPAIRLRASFFPGGGGGGVGAGGGKDLTQTGSFLLPLSLLSLPPGFSLSPHQAFLWRKRRGGRAPRPILLISNFPSLSLFSSDCFALLPIRNVRRRERRMPGVPSVPSPHLSTFRRDLFLVEISKGELGREGERGTSCFPSSIFKFYRIAARKKRGRKREIVCSRFYL